MKRILLLVLIVVVGGYGTAYWLIRSNVQTQLDEAALSLSGVGRLSYGQIWVSPLGTVSVDNLSFDASTQDGYFSISRSSLETANLLELYQLGQSLRNNDIPERLALSFEGIQLDLSGLQAMAAANGTARQDLLAAGCGEERTYFNFTDLDNMGFRQIRSDMVLEYQLSPARDNLRVNSEFTSDSMFKLSMLIDLGIDLTETPGPGAMMGATLNQVQFRMDDLGYIPQVMAYCARETGLSVEAYQARHVSAWERLWQQQGVVLGEDVVNAYATFIDQPDSLRLESFARLNAMQAMMIGDPQALLDRIAPQIVVNGGEPTPLQLSLALPQPPSNGTTDVNPDSAQSGLPSTVEDSSPEPREPSRRIIEVPVAQLSDWLATDMIITLTDGREFRGEVLSLDERQVRFSQAVVGGTMVIPIDLSSIRQVRVLNQ